MQESNTLTVSPPPGIPCGVCQHSTKQLAGVNGPKEHLWHSQQLVTWTDTVGINKLLCTYYQGTDASSVSCLSLLDS